MIQLPVLIAVCIFFYCIDFLSAIEFSEKNYQAFRKHEGNKSLVWYVEQAKLTKSNKPFIVSHIYSLINFVAATLTIGAVGYYIFDLQFSTGVGMFVIVQTIAHIIGVITNTIALRKFKGEE